MSNAEERIKRYRPMVQRIRFNAFANPVDGTMGSHIRSLPLRMMDVPGITCPDALVRVTMAFEIGLHQCGWWKNSDYDRALHLGLSIQGVITPLGPRYYKRTGLIPLDYESGRKAQSFGLEEPPREEVRHWAELAFSDLHPMALRWLWKEPAVNIKGVVHLRLFFNKQGQPILPEGEVYHLKPWKDGTSPEKVFSRVGT